MKCPNCHKRIDDDCDFCIYCGHKIIRERICPKCGCSNDTNAMFCKKCGSSLVEEAAAEEFQKVDEEPIASAEPKKRGSTKNKGRALPIVAMSLMLFAFLLLLVNPFMPFFHSSFFPDNDFTMIGWAVALFKTGFDNIFENYQYLELTHAIVLLILLTTQFVLTSVFIGLSIPKFVKAIKNKTFEDFSRRVSELYVIFLATYVYFTKFVMNSEKIYADSIGFGVMFSVVVIPLIIIFNNVVAFLGDRSSYSLKERIMRTCSSTVAFILVMVAINCLGGDRFFLRSEFVIVSNTGSTPITGATTSVLGNLDLITFFLENSDRIYQNSVEIIISALTVSGVSAFIEIIILVLFARLLSGLLSSGIKKQGYISGIVYSSVIFVLAVVVYALNTTTLGFVNQLDSVSKYRCVMNGTLENQGLVVTYLVISLFLLANFIVLLIFDRTSKKEDK